VWCSSFYAEFTRAEFTRTELISVF